MDSKDKIVESASRMFWQRGYSTTSPRQIMRASNVGQGSFYHHFPTKSELGQVAIERNARDILAAAGQLLSGDGPGLDRLCAYLLAPREVLAGCRVGGFSYDAGVVQAPELHRLLAGAFEQLRELVETVVREAGRDGSLRHDLDPTELADMVVAVVQGGYVTARATGDPAGFVRAVRGAVALLRADNPTAEQR